MAYIDVNNEIVELELLIKSLTCIDPSIFIKDENGKYVFLSHSWIKKDGTDYHKSFDVNGKKDTEIKRNLNNAQLAENTDKILLDTAKEVSYVISENYNGIATYLRINKQLIEFRDKKYIVGTITDITKEVKYEETLKDLAYRDELTECLNRKFLNGWYRKNRNSDIYPLALIMVDCNDLKKVNDVYGHEAGDEYIKNAAKALRVGLSKDSYIIRYGGDEFLVVRPRCDENKCIEYIKNVKNACEESLSNVSIALGSKIITDNSIVLSEAIKEADNNMYLDKKAYKESKKLVLK